jgi:hypothetical protein
MAVVAPASRYDSARRSIAGLYYLAKSTQQHPVPANQRSSNHGTWREHIHVR